MLCVFPDPNEEIAVMADSVKKEKKGKKEKKANIDSFADGCLGFDNGGDWNWVSG